MKASTLRHQIYPTAPKRTNVRRILPPFTPFKQPFHESYSRVKVIISKQNLGSPSKTTVIEAKPVILQKLTQVSSNGNSSRFMIVGVVSIGLALLFVGTDVEKAMALGPEGPLMEEFWDNVRRYALYALTVSTGAIYTILQPIVELLKNPISAILILLILGGSIYLVSQILTAMVGLSDVPYSYEL